MAAPLINPLPAPPSRANPAQFPARGDAFLGALPALATQINALVAYWNAELDTSAFINRNVASTMEATLTFALPPVMRASATAGEQTALRLSKGTTQRQAVNVRDDGGLNIVGLNGAQNALYVGGQRVYTAGFKPTPADLGALAASQYTAADVLAKLQTIVGGTGNILNAQTLGGASLADVRNASQLASGTVPDARLPANIVRSTRRVNTGDGINGGNALTGDLTLSVDATVARRDADNIFNQVISKTGSLRTRAAGNTHLWFDNADGSPRSLIWAAAASNFMRFRSYTADGSSYLEASLDGASGIFAAPEFSGGGERLLRLNASAMDRGTLPDARLSGNILRNTRRINTGDGLNGGNTLAGDLTLSVDPSVVRTGRLINANNGLVGGGSLGANVGLALGVPSPITADSGNVVTGTSHTHSLSRDAVLELVSRAQVGDVGTYAALKSGRNGVDAPGSVFAGSNLSYCAFGGRTDHPGISGSTQATGSWRTMGFCSSFNGTGDQNNATLRLRIS